MFDRIAFGVSPHISHHHNHTLTEKRAPTDESVRLLREMEDKAKAEVISSVEVTDNSFQCVIHTMKDFMSQQTKFKAIWSLNGVKHTTDYAASESDDTAKAIMALRDAIARDIANLSLRTINIDRFGLVRG